MWKIIGVTCKDKMRNEEVKKKMKERQITVMIEKCRLKWLGHVERMNRERFPRDIMKWKSSGKRKKGRPKLAWSVEGIGKRDDCPGQRLMFILARDGLSIE